MKRKTRIISTFLAVALLGGTAGVVYYLPDTKPSEKPTEKPPPKTVKNTPKKHPNGKKNSYHRSQREKIVKVETGEGGPRLQFSPDEKEKLSDTFKALLKEITDAFDSNDKKGLLRIVQRMQKMEEWPDGIPDPVKVAAIEALKWYGTDCLPEVAGFLGDLSEDIRNQAVDVFDDALFEANGDEERANLLKMLAQMPFDSDAFDSFFMSFSDLRPSRVVETGKWVLEHGTPTAQKAAFEALEMATGEDAIRNGSDLDRWYSDPDNQDDPDTVEDMYGRQEDDDD